jgi:serine-type D-Ala-D-Ala carboxypeptidase (penicillin-binding protein 5/6)
VSKKKSVALYNQNSLLTSYPGAVGGKIGWTSAAGATYVGMAKRNGVTLIVTLLHCPALTEITSAMKLLNWGFAEDGKVRPVGSLVGALQPAVAPSVAPAATGRPVAAVRGHASSPSVLAAVGFSLVTLIVGGLGFVYLRRQRPRGSSRGSSGASSGASARSSSQLLSQGRAQAPPLSRPLPPLPRDGGPRSGASRDSRSGASRDGANSRSGASRDGASRGGANSRSGASRDGANSRSGASRGGVNPRA